MSLTLFLVLWWASPVAVRLLVETSFYEFQAPLFKTTGLLYDLQSYWGLRLSSKEELISAGRDLARFNAASSLYVQENEALKEELARIEKLLNLSPLPGYRYERARVIHRELSAWQQEIIIDKGRNDSITSGSGVIFTGGVVGRVRTVYARSAIVELASSPRFRVAAHIEKDPRPITYQGAPNLAFTPPSGRVSDVPSEITFLNGSTPSLRVLTSRLGGVFPTGLIIGKLHKLHPEPGGLFLTGKVSLDKRLLDLREVVVLLSDKQP